jgi:hypothetical protein
MVCIQIIAKKYERTYVQWNLNLFSSGGGGVLKENEGYGKQ